MDNIPFPARFKSNGARESLIEIFAETFNHPATVVDAVLVDLWARGFKVVPLETGAR